MRPEVAPSSLPRMTLGFYTPRPEVERCHHDGGALVDATTLLRDATGEVDTMRIGRGG